MSAIVWDEISARTYETGLDRGVLYPPDAPAVPWNGLVEVEEKFDHEVDPVYYDGQKINDLVNPGDFAANVKAVTFPDAFSELEGFAEVNPGMLLGNQKPTPFGLSFRTLIGDTNGETAGYKLHIVYNATAVPADRTRSTLTDAPSVTPFEWDITAVPEEVPGYRPTAHIVINSSQFDSEFLELIEDMLYGTEDTDPELIPMAELIIFLLSWFSVVVVDNGDGTWTAYSSRPEGDNPITFPADGEFAISEVNGVYLDADTYEIHS